MRSSRVNGNRSSSLYAGRTTDSDFVGSEKIDGGGTCKMCWTSSLMAAHAGVRDS